jgi:hypothetical protein
MARRSRQKRAAYMDRSIGLLLILVGIVLIRLLIGGAWWIDRSTPTIDAETNCPVSGHKVVHVLMFDRSDPISGQQAQRIKFGVNELKRTADFGYRFDIYTFEGDSKSALEPNHDNLYPRCKRAYSEPRIFKEKVRRTVFRCPRQDSGRVVAGIKPTISIRSNFSAAFTDSNVGDVTTKPQASRGQYTLSSEAVRKERKRINLVARTSTVLGAADSEWKWNCGEN